MTPPTSTSPSTKKVYTPEQLRKIPEATDKAIVEKIKQLGIAK